MICGREGNRTKQGVVGCEAYAPSQAVPPVRSHRLGQIPGTKRFFSIFMG